VIVSGTSYFSFVKTHVLYCLTIGLYILYACVPDVGIASEELGHACIWQPVAFEYSRGATKDVRLIVYRLMTKSLV